MRLSVSIAAGIGSCLRDRRRLIVRFVQWTFGAIPSQPHREKREINFRHLLSHELLGSGNVDKLWRTDDNVLDLFARKGVLDIHRSHSQRLELSFGNGGGNLKLVT